MLQVGSGAIFLGWSNSDVFFVGWIRIRFSGETNPVILNTDPQPCSVICCWFDEDQDYKGINVTR